LIGEWFDRGGVNVITDLGNSAVALATAVTKQGGDKWFFLTPDYAAGHALQRDSTAFVEAAGGKVVSAAIYPFPATTG
jgi:branched-chain amino acid transport system substrate-binding protein